MLQPFATSSLERLDDDCAASTPEVRNVRHRRGAATARVYPRSAWPQASALPSAHNERRLSMRDGSHAQPWPSARGATGQSLPEDSSGPRTGLRFDRRASLPASRLAQLGMPRSLHNTPREGGAARPQTAGSRPSGSRASGSVQRTPRPLRTARCRAQTSRGQAAPPPFKTGKAPASVCGPASGAECAPNTTRGGLDGSKRGFNSIPDVPALLLRDPPQPRHVGAPLAHAAGRVSRSRA